jgi:transcriptional regulator with XRE-family HTH domain
MGASNIPPVNGALIYRRRRELGLTQVELGQRCGELGYEMDQTNISRLESGVVRRPSRRILLPLAGALDLRISDLLTADADDKPYADVA